MSDLRFLLNSDLVGILQIALTLSVTTSLLGYGLWKAGLKLSSVEIAVGGLETGVLGAKISLLLLAALIFIHASPWLIG